MMHPYERAAGPEPAHRPPRRAVWDRAEEILAGRHARGEIGDDEYNRRLTTLRRGHSGRGAPVASRF